MDVNSSWDQTETATFQVGNVPDDVMKDEKPEGTGGRIVWRCVNVLMMLFFVMAAGVQFNDPDPYLWVPLYGIASLLTAAVAYRPTNTGQKIWRFVYWIHTVFSTFLFLYVLVDLFIAFGNSDSDGKINPLTYEEGRELAGITITEVWLLICKQSPTIRCFSTDHFVQCVSIFIITLSLLPLFLWSLFYSEFVNPQFSVCKDAMMMDNKVGRKSLV